MARRRSTSAQNRCEENNTDYIDKPPDDPKTVQKPPLTGDVDKIALVYRKIMLEADQQITSLERATGAPRLQ